MALYECETIHCFIFHLPSHVCICQYHLGKIKHYSCSVVPVIFILLSDEQMRVLFSPKHEEDIFSLSWKDVFDSIWYFITGSLCLPDYLLCHHQYVGHGLLKKCERVYCIQIKYRQVFTNISNDTAYGCVWRSISPSWIIFVGLCLWPAAFCLDHKIWRCFGISLSVPLLQNVDVRS